MHKDERVNFFINVELRQNGECVFSVVENNEFKRLTHLALRFRSATDEILKNYLSQRLSKYTIENDELKVRCKKTEDAL
jgi:spindle assembly abnormal protein 6